MADDTTITRVSSEEFHLDTKNFNTLITNCQNLAKNMSELKTKLDKISNNLADNWIGKGSNSYQKKYKILKQQLQDVKDELYEISDKLSADYNAYMQADTDLAKTMTGTDNRF